MVQILKVLKLYIHEIGSGNNTLSIHINTYLQSFLYITFDFHHSFAIMSKIIFTTLEQGDLGHFQTFSPVIYLTLTCGAPFH